MRPGYVGNAPEYLGNSPEAGKQGDKVIFTNKTTGSYNKN